MRPGVAQQALQPDTAARFTLVLAEAALPGDLQRWFDQAGRGARERYARGIDLPREAPGVQLVTRWREAGLVRTFNSRDPLDGRRWLFIVEKVNAPVGLSPGGYLSPETAGVVGDSIPAAGGGGPSQVPAAHLPVECLALLEALRTAAAGGAACPSNAGLARGLGWRGEAGRLKARDQVRKLEAAGAIRVERRGTQRPRVVTILAAGVGEGLSTSSGER